MAGRDETQEVAADDVGRLPADVFTPAPAGDDRVHVGDAREALARAGAGRPLRAADPLLRPPAAAPGKVLEKGKVYWVVNTDDLDRPRQGKVVRLTRTAGKHVGVEFEQPVGAHVVHDCDGAGRRGHCLYCRVDQVLTNDEYRAFYERHRAFAARPTPVEDLDSLTLAADDAGRPTVH